MDTKIREKAAIDLVLEDIFRDSSRFQYHYFLASQDIVLIWNESISKNPSIRIRS